MLLLLLSDICFSNLQFPNNLQPTVVLASFFWFAVERYAIYLRRLKGEPQPWTDDSILQAHKFTNTFRVLDRVSQYLLKEIIYRPGLPMEPEEIVFRILLFKLFNSILAWKVLLQNFGMPTWAEFNEKAYAKVFGDAWKEGKGVRIWNPAYVQNQNYRTDLPTKHERYLALLKYMMDDQVADRLQGSQTYEQAYRILQNYPLHGQRFLPMQHLTDINYSPVLNFDEDDFITPGDGAMRGIQKCFGRRVSVPEAQSIIYNFVDEQEVYFKRLGYEPVTLCGCRRLHAIDIQNLFCEVDKYARVAHPEFKVKDGERIKQSLKPVGPLPVPFFPPKWKISA
jgi:hypothetical protein